MKIVLTLIAVVLLNACATTNPGSGAGIYYRLPRTDVKVTLGIRVKECSPVPDFDGPIRMDAVAGSQDGRYYVDGEHLNSAVTKRALTIDIDENGTLSAVNATATDQRSVILGNVLKIAASVAGLAVKGIVAGPVPPPTPAFLCSDATESNLRVSRALKVQIAQARSGLPAAKNPEAVQKQIDAYAAQLVAATAGLKREATATIKLERSMQRGSPVPVELDLDSVKELFRPLGGADLDKALKNEFAIVAYYDDVPMTDALGTTKTFSKTDACGFWLVVPDAKDVRVTLDTSQSGIRNDEGGSEFHQVVSAAQLTPIGSLCLSAAFAENRAVGLKFDKFGRRSELTWTSDASAANAASAIASATPDAVSIINGVKGRDLAAAKAELDTLTTEQALKQARDCQALLDAGASTCGSD